jgi:hypothetical protein
VRAAAAASRVHKRKGQVRGQPQHVWGWAACTKGSSHTRQ